MSITELKNKLAGREAAYRLLSVCYYQPCAEWNQAKLLPNLVSLCTGISLPAGKAAECMSETWNSSVLEELTVEYARLFVGPMSLQAPPYGSVYLEHDRQVMGESTMAVIQFYRDSGLNMDAEFTDMPDHIAVELEFVSYCLQQAVSANNQAEVTFWLDRANHFRDRFLMQWYSKFCAAIRSNSDSPFYQALADVTELVIATPLPSQAE